MGKLGDEWLSEKCSVLQGNPKRGKSAERYDDYKSARTLQGILDRGGSRADIVNDVVRGYVMLDDRSRHKQLVAVLNSSDTAVASRPYQPPAPEREHPAPSKKAPAHAAPAAAPAAAKKAAPPPPKRKLSPEEVEHERLVASTKARVEKYGRTVGKGRLLPYHDNIDFS